MSEAVALGTSGKPAAVAGASPWRRIAALMVDYFVFIVPLLGALTVVALILGIVGVGLSADARWFNHLVMLLTLTLPVILYFSVSEASRHQATVGKRLFRVRVVALGGGRITMRQSFIRSSIKFAPWEFFHMLFWHWEGWPTNPAPPSTLQMVAMVAGWIVIGSYLLGLFVGSGRTPYDFAAGTVAAPARTESMQD